MAKMAQFVTFHRSAVAVANFICTGVEKLYYGAKLGDY
jgi:hypothetical protein